MGETLTPSIWVAKDYAPRPIKIGVDYGRIWHYRAEELGKDRFKMLFRKTLCGRRAQEDWRPSWRNYNPKTCGKCTRLLAVFEAAQGAVTE